MAKVDRFVTRQPTDGQPARQPTVAYFGYTEDALHVVFVAFDPEPERVQAHLIRREEVFVVNDDEVELRIDTFNDRRQSYYFVSNPLGIQLDAAWPEGGGQYDESFDAVWHTEGRRTDQGFVVHMSIPFSSLRFPPGGHPWGVYVGRWIGRSGEWSMWPAVSSKQQSMLAQMARLEGISGVRTGRGWQLIPYGTYRSYRALNRRSPLGPAFVSDAVDPAVGLDAKVVVRDRLVLDATANPDFSQVESDAPQITANQRFEVFFPEKRPFFLENAGYLQTPVNLVFTRRIQDPQLGVRATGKFGRWTTAALVANDQAPGRQAPSGDPRAQDVAWAAVARARRDVGAQHNIGVLTATRALPGRTNTVASVDTRWRLSPTWLLQAQAGASVTDVDAAPGRATRGAFSQTSLAFGTRAWTANTALGTRSPGFRADLGFVPRVDVIDATQTLNYLHHRKGIVQSWGPTLAMGRTWSHDGVRLDTVVQPGLAFNLQRLVGASVTYEFQRQGFRAGELPHLDAFRELDTRQWSASIGGPITKWLTFRVAGSGGRDVNFAPASGQRPASEGASTVSARAEVRPFHSVRVEGTYLRSALASRALDRPIFTSEILRGRASWQISREWSLRTIVQYDRIRTDAALTTLAPRRNLNADVLITRLINPWTALYIGGNTNSRNFEIVPAGDGTREALTERGLSSDGRQVFVKMSVLLRR
jgi:hypothetical protein